VSIFAKRFRHNKKGIFIATLWYFIKQKSDSTKSFAKDDETNHTVAAKQQEPLVTSCAS
jgi:hypothetical protein